MGVRDFRELVAWQLVDELRQEIIAFTSTPGASRDFKYCNQILDAISSAGRNTAEGFGRFRPAEFARFLEFARASLNEVQDLLIEGREKKHIDEARSERLWTLSQRALAANVSLMKYQKKCAATGAKPWQKR